MKGAERVPRWTPVVVGIKWNCLQVMSAHGAWEAGLDRPRVAPLSAPGACTWPGFLGRGRSSFAPLRLSLCRQFGLGIASFYCCDRVITLPRSRHSNCITAAVLSLFAWGRGKESAFLNCYPWGNLCYLSCHLPALGAQTGCGFLCCPSGDEKSGSRKRNALRREGHCETSCPARSLSLQLHSGWWGAASSHPSGVVF